MNIYFDRTFYAIVSVLIVFLGLYFGKPVFTVAASATLLSFIIYPVALQTESWGNGRIGTSLLGMAGVLALAVGLIYLFSNQIINQL